MGSLLGLAGCATDSSRLSPLEKLRLLKRASFDLDCAGGPLHTLKLDDKTQVVRGCGRQAVYVYLCDGTDTWMQRCVWVKNG